MYSPPKGIYLIVNKLNIVLIIQIKMDDKDVPL